MRAKPVHAGRSNCQVEDIKGFKTSFLVRAPRQSLIKIRISANVARSTFCLAAKSVPEKLKKEPNSKRQEAKERDNHLFLNISAVTK